jgi:hypothetical protein
LGLSSTGVLGCFDSSGFAADDVEAEVATGFDRLRVGGGASVIDRDTDGGILPVVCGDSIAARGVRGGKPVRGRASATDRGFGSGTLPVTDSMNGTMVDGGASEEIGIDVALSVASVGGSMPGFACLFMSVNH